MLHSDSNEFYAGSTKADTCPCVQGQASGCAACGHSFTVKVMFREAVH